ncbi:hypothetical protein [Anoxybacter fermentans]|uniref:hypothetical protein n=1 Tax=Anoxybacter fermentans TaxID=1323375 RepID=UPI0013E0AE71|nr:hypothetical protein [Anoxybacter fermentans]
MEIVVSHQLTDFDSSPVRTVSPNTAIRRILNRGCGSRFKVLLTEAEEGISL